MLGVGPAVLLFSCCLSSVYVIIIQHSTYRWWGAALNQMITLENLQFCGKQEGFLYVFFS